MSKQVEKRWRMKPAGEQEAVERLTTEKCPGTAARLLVQRGIRNAEEASAFFRPDLAQLHDPFLMKDMDKAVKRLEQALGDGERIMVYGDYDVDGTTAVALVYSFLNKYTSNLTFYIPDRYSEGYGISMQGIDHAAADGVKLIIALDCGIKALAQVAHARSLGIDMIICDHHRPGEVLPDAVAVLDPKRPDCSYPFDELCGCGVGFKFMQAFAQHNDIPFDELLPLLDLVAVSTACDIVPVTGENRILAHFGTQRLNDAPRPGIKAMLQMSNVKKRLGITDLVFIVGPRINAAGRMEHGKQAVELLLAKAPGEADQMCLRVNGNNVQRQEFDRDITEQAMAMVADDEVLRNAHSTVVFDPGWHKGVIGIVASRLIETYYRPTVVLTESHGMATGSARSVKGFDVYAAIEACSDLLDRFGGHMYAAGMTLPLENVEAFRDRFEEVVRATLPEELRTPEELIDLELPLSEVNDRLLKVVEYMAPFGPGNMRPVFLARGVVDIGSARIVGEDHLKLCVRSADGTSKDFDAIAFRMAHHLPLVESGDPFSILYAIEANEWQGRVKLQLNIKDIKAGVDNVVVGGASAPAHATA